MSRNELINAINISKPTKNIKRIFLNKKRDQREYHKTLKEEDS